jgi:hypothetical protein
MLLGYTLFGRKYGSYPGSLWVAVGPFEWIEPASGRRTFGRRFLCDAVFLLST